MIKPFLLLLLCAALLAPACEKTTIVDPASQYFQITVYNHFSPIEAQCGAFLSDADGKVMYFRWVPAQDTAILTMPLGGPNDRFTCTIVKITTTLDQGIQDTTVELNTYFKVHGGTAIHLRNNSYQSLTDLHLVLTGFNTLDSLIVPDGMTFTEPTSFNNYKGDYKVFNTGKMWVRLKINGEPFWRYQQFDVTSDAVSATLNAADLPQLATPVSNIVFPFLSNWHYKVDHVINLSTPALLPLGDIIRVPGGFVPTWDQVGIQDVPGLPANGYRIQAQGTEQSQNPLTYSSDAFYSLLPPALPLPSFEIHPAGAISNRSAGVSCSGIFGLLHVLWQHSGNPAIRWDAVLKPETGTVTCKLPNVPTEVAQRFPALASYDFDPVPTARAEAYHASNAYDEALKPLLTNDDPLWQARAGYLGCAINLQ